MRSVNQSHSIQKKQFLRHRRTIEREFLKIARKERYFAPETDRPVPEPSFFPRKTLKLTQFHANEFRFSAQRAACGSEDWHRYCHANLYRHTQQCYLRAPQ